MNKTQPISLRLGPRSTSIWPTPDLLPDLEARGDSLGLVIKRDLARLYAIYDNAMTSYSLGDARTMYHRFVSKPLNIGAYNATTWATLDALERARILIARTGCTLDDALREVGLTHG